MSGTETSVLSILERVGAIIKDSHVVYTSGRHGSTYVNKDALFPYTAETSAVCAHLAESFTAFDVEVVAGPTMGGVILAQWVAHHLAEMTGRRVLAVYAEEQGVVEHRVLRRGYDALVADRRVLVVEDVITTGGSARKVIKAVQAAGGHVVAAGVICNRGGVTAAGLSVPVLESLVSVTMDSWLEDECPLCRDGIPINTQVGKGAQFLARRQTRLEHS